MSYIPAKIVGKAQVHGTQLDRLGSNGFSRLIKQTVSRATSHTDWSTDFTLNDFDTSLGTLTSVKAMLSDRWTTAGTVRNRASGLNSFNFSETTTISEAGGPRQLGVLTNTFDGNSVQYTFLAVGASAAYGPFTRTLSSTYSSVPADLASFETPGTFTLNLSTLSGTDFVGGGGNTTATLTTNADATLTLIYNYTPNTVSGSVPEPSSLALLGSGLCGVASLLRRRAF